jgi:hypothetical protein
MNFSDELKSFLFSQMFNVQTVFFLQKYNQGLWKDKTNLFYCNVSGFKYKKERSHILIITLIIVLDI